MTDTAQHRSAMAALLVATALLLGTGCGEEVEQTSACATFVSCVEARDSRDKVATPTNVARFSADGKCWGSPAGSLLCDRACVGGLAFLRDKEANLPTECKP